MWLGSSDQGEEAREPSFTAVRPADRNASIEVPNEAASLHLEQQWIRATRSSRACLVDASSIPAPMRLTANGQIGARRFIAPLDLDEFDGLMTCPRAADTGALKVVLSR